MSVRAVLASALALVVLVCGCAGPESEGGPLSEADASTIKNLAEREVVDLLLAKDMAAFAASFTEDAVRMPPNEPLQIGRAAIEEWARASWGPVTFVEGSQTVQGMDGRGDLAYAWGTFSFAVQLPGNEEPIADVGKFLVILRKQLDGSWLVSHSIYNGDSPAPVAAVPEGS